MKVVAINGSPRSGGNTETLLKKVFEPLEEAGIETELIQIGGRPIHGCRACLACRTQKLGRCVIDGDFVNECIPKIREADALLIGSPTYYADVSPEVKALIDRVGYVLGPEGVLNRKPAAAVLAVRRGGAVHAFDTINHFFLINGMLVVGASYWNMGFGREKEAVLQDEEGLRNMRVLGENMTWLLKKIH